MSWTLEHLSETLVFYINHLYIIIPTPNNIYLVDIFIIAHYQRLRHSWIVPPITQESLSCIHCIQPSESLLKKGSQWSVNIKREFSYRCVHVSFITIKKLTINVKNINFVMFCINLSLKTWKIPLFF